jgi:hypothetical protein
MIIPVICMAVTAALMIRPAIRHDNDLPISHTGKERK